MNTVHSIMPRKLDNCRPTRSAEFGVILKNVTLILVTIILFC